MNIHVDTQKTWYVHMTDNNNKNLQVSQTEHRHTYTWTDRLLQLRPPMRLRLKMVHTISIVHTLYMHIYTCTCNIYTCNTQTHTLYKYLRHNTPTFHSKPHKCPINTSYPVRALSPQPMQCTYIQFNTRTQEQGKGSKAFKQFIFVWLQWIR